ncbi:MAG: NADH dehydrogenase (quinone) subunit G [Acidobacteria bacterium]|nr:MAG: NADH dehydrogenase (quinone) subunit G [Acidobacteriota bacterium]
MAETAEIKFKLDDRQLTVRPGTLVIEAAREQGIEVPSFCYYQGLALQAACRMCLVEVEKAPKLQTACTLVAVNGMVVRTNTPQVHEARKSMLEFLLANHPLDCPVCDKGGECELQDMTFRYGADRSRFVEEKLHVPEVKWSNIVYYDAPRCILCFRCVRVCDEGMDVKALGVGQRGANSVIIPNRDGYLECVECGMCIDICPVGALTSGTYRYHTRPWEMQYVPTVCAHCSNGCKTTLSVRNHEIIRANNRDLSGYNGDFLCAKGRFAFDFTRHPERLNQPLIRLGGKLDTASWEEALQAVASRLAAIRKQNGPEAIGFYGSNRTTNEENYLLGRIARASIGTNNVDHHRTADYAGLMQLAADLAGSSSGHGGSTAGGSGGIFATMRDLESAPAILLIGNDATEQNPLVAWQIRTAIRNHRSRLYILDSREQKLNSKAQASVLFARGEEAAAIGKLAPSGTANLAETDLDRRLHPFRDALAAENDVVVLFGAAIQGAALARLSDFARERVAAGKRTRFIALGDYANSRGAADMGLLPEWLPGYAPIANPAAREAFGKIWGATLPEKPGLDSRAMLDATAAGQLKALYVVGANPAKKTNFVGSKRMGKLDLLVVQDLYLSETARLADIVLPALSAFEKNGTMTNTAGEVQLVRQGGDFMGARSDFDILRILSHQLAQQRVGQPIPLRTPDAAFEEIARTVPGYAVSWAGLLSGTAEPIQPNFAATNGHRPAESAAGVIFSNNDSLFTSGSLTPYCRMIRSLREAGVTP